MHFGLTSVRTDASLSAPNFSPPKLRVDWAKDPLWKKKFQSYANRGKARFKRQRNGCIFWLGATTPKGHAPDVHRGIFEHFYCPIPKGFECHHKCGNPRCCHPGHLQALPKAEHRAVSGGKGDRPRTLSIAVAKIRFIIQLTLEGHTQQAIAAELGISDGYVSQILNGQKWGSYTADLRALLPTGRKSSRECAQRLSALRAAPQPQVETRTELRLAPCMDCGRSLSKRATFCPGCGCPEPFELPHADSLLKPAARRKRA